MNNTKLSKSQTGFSPLHVLLLIVLFGIVGFAGWKVYDTNKATKVTTNSSSPATAAKKDESKPAVPTIPEGFVEYQNKDLGFKFAYPKEWGEVSKKAYVKEECASAIKQTGAKVNGEIYQLVFSKNNDKKVYLRTNDFKVEKGIVYCLDISTFNYNYSDLAGKGFTIESNVEYTVTTDGHEGGRENYFLFGLVSMKLQVADGLSVSLHSVKDRFEVTDEKGAAQMKDETKNTLTSDDKKFMNTFKAL